MPNLNLVCRTLAKVYQTAMEKFYQRLIHWIQQSDLQDFAAKLSPRTKTTEPTPTDLWQPFLKTVLTPPELCLLQQSQRPNFAQVFLGRGLFATTEDFYKSTEATVLKCLNENRKQELSKQFFTFHTLCNQWRQHGWHLALLKQPEQSCLQIAQQLNLPAWQVAHILHEVGYTVVHSKQFLKVWQQYSEQHFETYKAWVGFLESSHDPAIFTQLDAWADWFFDLPKLQQLLGYTLPNCQWIKNICTQIQGQNPQLNHQLLIGNASQIPDQALIQRIIEGVKNAPELPAKKHYLHYQHNYDDFLSTIENEDWVSFWKAIYEFERRTKTKKIAYGEKLTNANQVFNYMQTRLANQKQEILLVFILDNQSKIIQTQQISKGTIDESLAHPREIFYPAIQLRASSILLVHNHPSGDPRPSPQDLQTTQHLCKAGALLNIHIVDHIIISKEKFYSFVEHGNIPMYKTLKSI